MFSGLDTIDWAALDHAYGPAGEVPALLVLLRSPDPERRGQALDDFYVKVHHQGSIYSSTGAALPFLIEIAADASTPDRGGVMSLVASIGKEAAYWVDAKYEAGGVPEVIVGCFAANAKRFQELAADDDWRVREAAAEAVVHSNLPPADAAAFIKDRFAAEAHPNVQLALAAAMAALVESAPETTPAANVWLDAAAADPRLVPEVRFGALAYRVKCAPEAATAAHVDAAVALLNEFPVAGLPEYAAPKPLTGDVPPQIRAVFAEMDRAAVEETVMSRLLEVFHDGLAGRTVLRAQLLTAALGHADPALRLDGVKQTRTFMTEWRGDHGPLIDALAALLDGDDRIAAEAARTLATAAPIAERARTALAAAVARHRDTHGALAWSVPDPVVRECHQEAVRALARLGDEQAMPSFVDAFDSGTDVWRAVQVAGCLPAAANEFVPRLVDYLNGLPHRDGHNTTRNAAVTALGRLGDPAAVPVLIALLPAPGTSSPGMSTPAVLRALTEFGPDAAAALAPVQALTASDDSNAQSAAVAALWAITGDTALVLPHLRDLLEADTSWFSLNDAADIAADIGSEASDLLPQLRDLLNHNYDWVRIHAAAAVWSIAGAAEAPIVLDVLLQAWEKNPAVAGHVTTCLLRMGDHAAPVADRVRAALAEPGRSGRLDAIADDEVLQANCRALLARFTRS